MDRETSRRVVSRFVEASAKQQALDVLSKINSTLDKVSQWFSKYDSVRRACLQDTEGLDAGLVWSDQFRKYLKDGNGDLRSLWDLNQDDLWDLTREDAYDSKVQDAFSRVEWTIKMALSESSHHKSHTATAVNGLVLQKKPDGSSGIAYRIENMDAWAKAFEDWIKELRTELKAAIARVKKIKN